jgi:hydroxylaminobenzene mutase
VDEKSTRLGHRLLQLGVFLFLLGLLTGLAVPMLAHPRMGLSSHLEGVLNGIFLIAIGLLWPRLSFGRLRSVTTFWLLVYGTFANWIATLLAAIWSATGAMPLAGGGISGTPLHEYTVLALLVSLTLAMIAACVLLLSGLYVKRNCA